MTSDINPIIVGRFGKTFGLLGWIKIISFTYPEENILKLKPWFIKRNGDWEEFSFKEGKKKANGITLKLPDCNSPEEAALYTNIEIGVLKEQLPKLENDEYYWHDLVGLDVINQNGVKLGTVKEVIATGSNDVLVITGEKRHLVPYLSNVIQHIDLDKKIIKVDWDEDF